MSTWPPALKIIKTLKQVLLLTGGRIFKQFHMNVSCTLYEPLPKLIELFFSLVKMAVRAKKKIATREDGKPPTKGSMGLSKLSK